MRFISMHRTQPKWEAGEKPSPELIAKVGQMMGEVMRSGVLVDGAGLRASSLGVRLSFNDGKRRVTNGPFQAADIPASGFLILRVASLEEAMEWMTRYGQIVGDLKIELRPVTEVWDIGMGPRPPDLKTTRFMALLHDPAAEAGRALPSEREAGRTKLLEEMTKADVLLGTVAMQPTARGARLRREGAQFVVRDGPFAESKELIAGYVILELPSRDDAVAWLRRYADAVDADEYDLREIASAPP